MRRDVADGEADAPIVGVVGAGTVDQAHVVQRGLARLQHDIDGRVLVHLVLYDLAAREHVVLAVGVAVRDLIQLVGAGRNPHGTRFHRAGRERDPGGHHLKTAQAPIGRILMPGDVGRIVRVLGEEERSPAEEVGTEQVLHCVEHRLVADQAIERRHQAGGADGAARSPCSAKCRSATSTSARITRASAAEMAWTGKWKPSRWYWATASAERCLGMTLPLKQASPPAQPTLPVRTLLPSRAGFAPPQPPYRPRRQSRRPR